MRGINRIKGATYQQFLAAILMDRFDSQMMHEWTSHAADSTTLPEIKDVLAFFRKREFSLPDDPTADKVTKTPKSTFAQSRPKSSHPVLKVQTSSVKCPLCASNHSLSRCPTFLSYDPMKRQQVAKEKQHCTNCLSHNHHHKQCPSTFNCRNCNKRHHTLLHRDANPSTSQSPAPQSQSSAPQSETPPSESSRVSAGVATSTSSIIGAQQTSAPQPGLLNTAIVDVINGPRTRRARIALDPGASVSLMSESLASSLILKRHPHRFIIDGILGDGQSKYYVEAKLKSLFSDESVTFKFCVVPKIPTASPPKNPNAILKDPSVRDKVPIADSSLGGNLDALIGSLDVIRCQKGSPVNSQCMKISATPTIFGWTVIGPLDHSDSKPVLKVEAKEDTLHHQLQLLWEFDRLPDIPVISSEDELALHHFEVTHEIQPDGRYVVSLPRVKNPPELGESRSIALRRFVQNERSLQRKEKIKQFNDVIEEYFTLDHAEPVPPNETKKTGTTVYYMPVQGVIKDSSTTTKLRAVFDASSPSSSGISLNDTLLTGPSLYPLLTDIILRFRLHKIAFSADIGKMFREIVLHPKERDLHRFLHRDKCGQIRDFRMKRLTFGVKSSPFLATKVIRHLAESSHESHPQASNAILNSFYVDDLLSGASSISEAKNIQEELCDLLKSAGMNLRKWRSNCLDFRNSIPQELLETADLQLPSPLDSTKALGMHWDVKNDAFHISVPSVDNQPITKRVVASVSAKVYDVLGLFAPAVIPSKILLQELWQLQLNWDTPIPDHLEKKWHAWASELSAISSAPTSG